MGSIEIQLWDLEQELAKLFCQGPDNKYFGFVVARKSDKVSGLDSKYKHKDSFSKIFNKRTFIVAENKMKANK